MSIAFMALFAGIVVDRIDEKAGRILLPALVILGIVSVSYWHLTERAGDGDLRLYIVVQFFPMLAIPLICLLFPPRKLNCGYVVPMFLLYTTAKVFEHLDDEMFTLLGHTISGHSLKHLFAAMAALMALPMLKKVGVRSGLSGRTGPGCRASGRTETSQPRRYVDRGALSEAHFPLPVETPSMRAMAARSSAICGQVRPERLLVTGPRRRSLVYETLRGCVRALYPNRGSKRLPPGKVRRLGVNGR